MRGEVKLTAKRLIEEKNIQNCKNTITCPNINSDFAIFDFYNHI